MNGKQISLRNFLLLLTEQELKKLEKTSDYKRVYLRKVAGGHDRLPPAGALIVAASVRSLIDTSENAQIKSVGYVKAESLTRSPSRVRELRTLLQIAA